MMSQCMVTVVTSELSLSSCVVVQTREAPSLVLSTLSDNFRNTTGIVLLMLLHVWCFSCNYVSVQYITYTVSLIQLITYLFISLLLDRYICRIHKFNKVLSDGRPVRF